VIQPVYRYVLPMPPLAGFAPQDISKPAALLELIFRVRFVQRKGCNFHSLMCESCWMSAMPREELISSPDFSLNVDELPEGVWEWMRHHAEMHICIGQWYRRIDR
jgi:hypothetical protein